jgi:hypothetical protein
MIVPQNIIINKVNVQNVKVLVENALNLGLIVHFAKTI